MTEYRSISTHGMLTSKHGVFGSPLVDFHFLNFDDVAVFGGSGIGTGGSGGASLCGLPFLLPNSPRPKTRFHPAVLGGSSGFSFGLDPWDPLLPFLDREVAGRGTDGDATTKASAGRTNAGLPACVSASRLRNASLRSAMIPSDGLPRAIPIRPSSSVAMLTAASSAGGGGVCCAGRGEKDESFVSGGGDDFFGCGGDTGRSGDASPKNIEVLFFRSIGFADEGGFHVSGRPSAIMDSRVLEMLFLRPSRNRCGAPDGVAPSPPSSPCSRPAPGFLLSKLDGDRRSVGGKSRTPAGVLAAAVAVVAVVVVVVAALSFEPVAIVGGNGNRSGTASRSSCWLYLWNACLELLRVSRVLFDLFRKLAISIRVAWRVSVYIYMRAKLLAFPAFPSFPPPSVRAGTYEWNGWMAETGCGMNESNRISLGWGGGGSFVFVQAGWMDGPEGAGDVCM